MRIIRIDSAGDFVVRACTSLPACWSFDSSCSTRDSSFETRSRSCCTVSSPVGGMVFESSRSERQGDVERSKTLRDAPQNIEKHNI